MKNLKQILRFFNVARARTKPQMCKNKAGATSTYTKPSKLSSVRWKTCIMSWENDWEKLQKYWKKKIPEETKVTELLGYFTEISLLPTSSIQLQSFWTSLGAWVQACNKAEETFITFHSVSSICKQCLHPSTIHSLSYFFLFLIYFDFIHNSYSGKLVTLHVILRVKSNLLT